MPFKSPRKVWVASGFGRSEELGGQVSVVRSHPVSVRSALVKKLPSYISRHFSSSQKTQERGGGKPATQKHRQRGLKSATKASTGTERAAGALHQKKKKELPSSRPGKVTSPGEKPAWRTPPLLLNSDDLPAWAFWLAGGCAGPRESRLCSGS